MPETLKIVPVTDKRQLNAFIKFPWKIYKRDPNWVPPLLLEQKATLNPKTNPFFLHSEVQNFLALRNGDLVGRISAIVDENYNDFQSQKCGFFGFFESINDKEVSRALFSTAAEWVQKPQQTYSTE